MSESNPIPVPVPLLDATLAPPPKDRVRALKRHLIRSLRALRDAKRPDRLIQKTAPIPAGFAADVVAAGCATCRGHCCMGGGEHAYIDERTMARVRRDNPDLDAGAVIRAFLARVAPASFAGSCLFHGPAGCTLGRGLRAELCNAYYCNGLRDFLKLDPAPARVEIVATRHGKERRLTVTRSSPVMTMAEPSPVPIRP